jgi:hypothetical protein
MMINSKNISLHGARIGTNHYIIDQDISVQIYTLKISGLQGATNNIAALTSYTVSCTVHIL